MLDAIKAFAQGWKTKGKFPGVDPYLPKPYTDAVIWFLEDRIARTKVKMAICDADENTTPFDFSYDVFAFSLSKTVAYLKNNGQEQQQFITEMLRQLVDCVGKDRPSVCIGQALIMEEELRTLHKLYRLTDGVESISRFSQMEIKYSALLDAVFSFQSVKMMEIVFREFGGPSSGESKIVAVTQGLSRYFVARATRSPTSKKESIFALRAASLLFGLMDTNSSDAPASMDKPKSERTTDQPRIYCPPPHQPIKKPSSVIPRTDPKYAPVVSRPHVEWVRYLTAKGEPVESIMKKVELSRSTVRKIQYGQYDYLIGPVRDVASDS